MPPSNPELRDIYVYPNPSVGSDNPTIHVSMGQVDRVEITILDISGAKVYSTTLDGSSPQISSDGQYFYEVAWTGEKASGVYVAIVHGVTSSATVKAKVKFAVVK